MKLTEFIEKLKASREAVFSFSDMFKILNKPKAYAKILINRLSKRELTRLEKNKYALRGTNPFLVASNLIFPSYISLISAYSYYGLTTQLPRIFYVITLRQRKPLSYEGNFIRFIKFKASRFFGFKREVLENKFFFVAEVEKAVIDSLYLPEYCNISETFFAIKNASLNLEKLIAFAKRMESKALLARLGYLLELANISVKELEPIPKNYIPLNPTLPKRGKKDRKWKLIINEVLR